MKKANKVLLLVLCAILLVAGSVMGTLAYLTGRDSVTNTFTVGKIAITMDETDVDEYGAAIDNAEPVKANEYNLIPGKTYTKDPEIHVAANSEDSHLFVKITSNIDSYIDVANIETQLDANGWQKLTGVTGVWYQSYEKNTVVKDVKVFESFTVLDNANNVAGWDNITSNTSKIEIVAYAIQAEETGNAAEAWAKLNAQLGNQ